MGFKFIVCVDVSAPDLIEAYRVLRKGLIRSKLKTWMTSEEWYGPGHEETAGPTEELQKAITAVLRQEDEV